ncbi:MAG: carboxymuconolactone decarboxylase family protein [Candidatus Dormibacteria bacterium]
MSAPQAGDVEVIPDSYRELTGGVPKAIESRLKVAEATGRGGAVGAIEATRRALVMDNPLGPKVGQTVHFAQLVALGKGDAARLHARAALRAGATMAELNGAVELALITAGMPAYSLGVDVLAELLEEAEAGGRRS